MDKETTFVTSASLAAVGVISISFYYYLKNVYSYWEKRGIPSPSPVWPLGNFHKLLRIDKLDILKQWGKDYGKIYGIYFGTTPQLVLNDPDLINRICIKDFDYFTDHFSDKYFNDYQRTFLFFAKGDDWRRMRICMSPTFTSAKIRLMFKFLDACADDLVACLNEQFPSSGPKEAIVNVKDIYSLYTMDAITNCCYNFKLERDKNVISVKSAAKRNKFVSYAMKIFETSIWRTLTVMLMPDFLWQIFPLKRSPDSLFEPIRYVVEKLMEKRRSQDKKYDDYLQMLLDAKIDDNSLERDDTIDSNEDHHANLSKESIETERQKLLSSLRKKANLTDFEIVTAGMFLILVGVETTATLLTQVSYLLAYHQEHQNRLYEEIAKINANKNGNSKKDSFEYEETTSCAYLDAVLSETLRMNPPFPLLNRVATQDYFLESHNLKIEKGTVVNLAGSSIMMNSEYFEKPDLFDPERFMTGRKESIKPGSYLPFGLGPRHCLGMRFSLTEAKLALAKIIVNFEFKPAPGEPYPAKPSRSPFLNSLHNSKVIIVPRQKLI